MIKYIKSFITFLLAVIALGANAQSAFTIATTSSPYSSFGLGTFEPALLPQNLAMGGIATAINRINLYNNINPENPASYGMINYVTIDAGFYVGEAFLSQNGPTGQVSTNNASFRLSHVTFAIPVNKNSAFSFGLLPYSEMGYNYVTTKNNFGTKPSTAGSLNVDTNAVNYINNGNGGLSKAYLGYGYHIGKHLLLGANVSYIFGETQQFQSLEVPNLYGMLNSRIEQDNSIGGLNYDYGIQYSFDYGEYQQHHIVLGYSASASSSLNAQSTYIVSQYTYSNNVENLAADTLVNQQNPKSKVGLPQINHFGVSYQTDGKFLIGADYTMGKWSALTIDGTNAGLQDQKTFNLGGQFTPDINALHSVLLRSDYRVGVTYEDTYLNVNNTDIKRYALTFGFGLPLSPTLSSFYKMNFSAELGQEGTLQNSLVKQKYINLHLAFTINDKWFQRFKFD
jgi:hypothetical protein